MKVYFFGLYTGKVYLVLLNIVPLDNKKKLHDNITEHVENLFTDSEDTHLFWGSVRIDLQDKIGNLCLSY